jgi:glycosyltransferase involved in cell wall biosynthesis
MPVFNAAGTLPVALASLQAQTFEDWECVIVNDGSTDHSEQIVQAVRDSRIRYHALDRNRGRGFARQCGMEIACGKYIAFLDADDWIYPDKLLVQKQLLDSQTDVALVSTGMAIANASDQLMGVRNVDKTAPVIHTPTKRLRMPPFAFAPSLIVAEVAKRTRFDTSFPIAEDVDFLLRAVSGQPWAVLHNALYVYREHGSATFPKVNSSLDHCCRMFAKHFATHPVRSFFEIAKARGKQGMYCAGYALGLWEYIIAQRSQKATAEDSQGYQSAWKIVSTVAASHSVAA